MSLWPSIRFAQNGFGEFRAVGAGQNLMHWLRAKVGARSLFCRSCGLVLFLAGDPRSGYCSPQCAERDAIRLAVYAQQRWL